MDVVRQDSQFHFEVLFDLSSSEAQRLHFEELLLVWWHRDESETELPLEVRVRHHLCMRCLGTQTPNQQKAEDVLHVNSCCLFIVIKNESQYLSRGLGFGVWGLGFGVW